MTVTLLLCAAEPNIEPTAASSGASQQLRLNQMPIPLPEFVKTADKAALANASAKAQERRREIVAQFPLNAWPSLPVERYALGTDQSQSSFSYALEYGSNELGSLAGGHAGKHLIYFSKKENAWKFDTAQYSSATDAWAAIRGGFCDAIHLAQSERLEEVDSISALAGAVVVKAKLLSIYFPDAILPVFSRKHIRHFLENLEEEVSTADYERSIHLNVRLARRLDQISELNGFNNDERVALLYRWSPPTAEEEQQKLIKIAPGEGASLWESECLPGGLICVGWDDVGDLRQFDDFAAFRAAFAEQYGAGYNGHEGTVTRKAKELWLLRDLEEGDLIAANKGTGEILAVGEIQKPGYVWDESRNNYKHTAKVAWDLEKSGPIERVPKWANITLEKLSGELREKILALNVNENLVGDPILTLMDAPKNTPINRIFYGPPGTGKTHRLRELFARYTDEGAEQDRKTWLFGLVQNCRWRDVIAAALAERGPLNAPAIRDHELVQAKLTASQASTTQIIQNNLKYHTPANLETVQTNRRGEPTLFTKTQSSIWSLLPGWEQEEERLKEFVKTYRAGPVTRSATKRYRTVTFHPSYSYEDFVRGIRPVASDEIGGSEFRLVDGVFKQICAEARANPTKRYALFIDEINRGNIAKIFGELITLIESDKRITVAADGSTSGGMTVQLPGSNTGEVAEPPFGVPANLDLYGTMNTADRSIALLDIALRRRFEFVEMPPLTDATVFPASVDGVDRGALLRRINDRLEYLLDRDHRIGHAYLMKAQSIADLRSSFANQIIPLLQEYFFDDLGKVALILSGPNGRSEFVDKKDLRHADLFPGDTSRNTGATRHRFEVTHPGTWIAEHFQGIYATATAVEGTEDEAAS